jgi:hypothetical protein
MKLHVTFFIRLYSSFVGPWHFFSLLILYTVGRTPCMGDQPVLRPLLTHTGQHKHRINAHKHPCLQMGFEPTTLRVRGGEDGSCLRPRGSCYFTWGRGASSLTWRIQHFSNCTRLVGQVLKGTAQAGPMWNAVGGGRLTGYATCVCLASVCACTYRTKAATSTTIRSG